MHILLTGATGFLGSALARHWVAAGHRVTALVRPGADHRRLAPVSHLLHWLQADGETLVDAVCKHPAQVVVHTACAYGRKGESPEQLFDCNVRLGLLLLQGLLARPGQRRASFMNCGTSLAPGISPYAHGKHQFLEQARQLLGPHGHRLQFINMQLQHVYGPGDDSSKFSSHVLRSCQRQVPALALTACTQRRDFIHLADAVAAMHTLLLRRAELDPFDTVDVGSGQAPALREFVQTAHRLLGSRTQLNFGALPPRPNEPEVSRADTRRLIALGWQPQHSLASGLQATIHAEFAAFPEPLESL